MSIRLDYSSWSVVAVCSCGWRGQTLDREAAWRLARAHELAVHPGAVQAAAGVRHASR